ncbi:MAG: alpha/beta hydrolase [Clostridia bacterium]|nr:alpha/beta hydrolase [Clostridia bacterium]
MIPSIGHLPKNPMLSGQAELKQRVVYSENGQTLTLALPWAHRDRRGPVEPTPLIVFVQGSGWTTPNLDYELPMLSRFAEEGIAVAAVCHRSTMDGHPFPAFLQDVKCAVRFLRAHAEEYNLSKEKVAAFGTSSGGHTVCLMGLTGDDPRYRTREYPEQSDAVCAVVSCFGPLELVSLFAQRLEQRRESTEERLKKMFGPDKSKWQEKLWQFSPALQVEKGKAYPSFLLLNGTGDAVVPCEQMERMYQSLRGAGASVRAYYVDGAEHEGNFWGPEVRRIIHDELTEKLFGRTDK